MVRGVSESAAGGSHSAGDVDSKSDPATQELDRALTEHNPAPPQPACCCVDPKDLQRGAFYSEWYHKYIYRTETLVKRTNVALRQKVGSSCFTRVHIAGRFAEPTPHAQISQLSKETPRPYLSQSRPQSNIRYH